MSELAGYLQTQLPDEAVLLALEPEELAEVVLVGLSEQKGHFSIHNELLGIEQGGPFVSATYTDRRAVQRAVAEAFAWLRGQGLIIETPGSSGSWYVLSRRAEKLASDGFAEFKVATQLPKAMLHPLIREEVWKSFLRGDYDVAVFTSMKAVEIAVRDASGLGSDILGVKLARQAFHPETGPLTDASAEAGERQARADLFAGALGSYKNPQSHRHVLLEDPAEATEQIMLASHLLRIVDGRRNAEASRS